jgi:predicted RNA-binding Zn-ribbon protein involved in translation (DUF1610 family)
MRRVTLTLTMSERDKQKSAFKCPKCGSKKVQRRWGSFPRTDRVSFSCAKFFVMIDTEEERFKCGMQVDRGAGQPPPDWDWHRLLPAPSAPAAAWLASLTAWSGASNFGSTSEASRSIAANTPARPPSAAPRPARPATSGRLPALLPHDPRGGPGLHRPRPGGLDAGRVRGGPPGHEPVRGGELVLEQPTSTSTRSAAISFSLRGA